MTQPDYEQQKKECWDAFDREHPHSGIITEMAFNFAFDYAFALGKQEKDAEGEEMLTVSRKRVQEIHRYHKELGHHLTADAIYDLFGSKCLPDLSEVKRTLSENLSEQKPTKPKFKLKDRVVRKYVSTIRTIVDIDSVSDETGTSYYYMTEDSHGNNRIEFIESDLELYTEPETSHETPVCENHSDDTSQKEVNVNSNRNLSQNIADCDKQLDNILKDSFRKERRLNIATRIISAILSNQRMLNNLAHGETTVEGAVRCVVDATMMYTDALIAECEKGGSHEKA